MFNKNVFDETAKSAKKFDDLISRSTGMKTLAALSATFAKNMQGADAQTDRLLNRVKQLTQATNEQALSSAGITKDQYKRVAFYQQELDAVTELEQKLKDQLAIDEKISQTTGSRVVRNRADKRIADTKAQLATLPARKAGVVDMKDIDKKLAKSGQFVKAIDGAFGGIATKLTNVVKALTGILAPFAILAAVLWFLKKGLNLVQDGLKEAIAQGLDASQRVAQMKQAAQVTSAAFFKGGLLDPIEVMKSMASLQERFGKLNIATELVQKSAELSRQIGLSADDAGNLLEFFVRIRKESGEAAAASATVIHATAIANNANPRKVMQDVANNAANFAKSGKASAESMAQAAIATSRMGVNLSTVSQIADKIVTNFEGTLEAQASIGAFAPGFDMTGLLVASQFGTDKDIASELKAAVDSLGTDFDSMPRSMKLAISSGLGVSVDELAKIASGDESTLSPDGEAMKTASQMLLNEVQQGIANPMASIERGVTGIWSILFNKFGGGKSLKDMNRDELSATSTGSTSGIASIWSSKPAEAAAMLRKQEADANLVKLTAQANTPAHNRLLEIAQREADVAKAELDRFTKSETKKQQEELQRSWVDSIKIIAGRPIEVTTITNLDGNAVAKSLTQPKVTRSGQF